MAKWYGRIGFSDDTNTLSNDGLYVDRIIERNYFGDVLRRTRRLQSSDSLNDNITITNSISIVSDPFANNNFHSIRYVEYMGTLWKVNDISVEYPRLILSLGGVWNGESTKTT